jgi:uncharacterized membrane protein
MGSSALDTRRLVITAVMIGVVAVFTLEIRVPIPATGGYFNLSDVAIFFTAFLFGPIPALIAGGVGAALADVLGGFPEFAWLSLIAHGVEGLLAGLIVARGGATRTLAGWAAGAGAMMLGYFLGETFVMTGIGPALGELPFNAVQVVVGGVVGTLLVVAVRRAYPPIAEIGRSRAWREL